MDFHIVQYLRIRGAPRAILVRASAFVDADGAVNHDLMLKYTTLITIGILAGMDRLSTQVLDVVSVLHELVKTLTFS